MHEEILICSVNRARCDSGKLWSLPLKPCSLDSAEGRTALYSAYQLPLGVAA